MPLTGRDGEKGPMGIEMVTRRVQTRLERKRTGPAEWLVVTRCLQAPLRSRTVGFPEYGSDHGFPLKVFLHMRKLKRWLAYTPLIPSLPSGSSAKAGSSDSRR
jgi:hypothetical protein